MRTIFNIFAFSLLIMLAGNLSAQSWNTVNSTGTSFILYGMSFPPDQSTVGFACGMQYTYNAPGVIVKTTDGGDNWTQIWPVSGTIDGLEGIWFINDNVGFACGWNNYFIKTTDGGATWNPITVGSDVWYYVDVVFWDSNNGVAAASMNNPGAQAVFITSDGGNSWVPATSGVGTNEIMGLAYADQNTVYAVGTGAHVFKSTDGGHNWTQQNTLSALLFGLDFANTSFGVVGGEEKMFSTTNGGSNWATFTTGYENFQACKAFSNGTAFVGGTDERIWKTTDFGQNWTLDNSGGSAHLYRIRFVDNGTGFACGSQGTILKYESPLEADFEADPEQVCTGGSVYFTDNSSGAIDSWAWTFEGGTPSTSTVQNPVVTYSVPGEYDVELTVYGGGNSSTETKTDFITVIQAAGQPNTPSGPAEACGGGEYEYSTQPVPYAESYDWQVDPSSAGTMSGEGTEAIFEASNSWSGQYTIKVRAENDCGSGPWSPTFTGTLYPTPSEFFLTGDGAYCEGDPGAEITLDGSETGVDYELFKDNVTTGTIIPGTGSPISFGYFTETGLYTAEGYTASCTNDMLGQIYVHMESLPGQAGTPAGPDEVCNDESTQYTTTGASDADDYQWTLDPAEAGTLISSEDEVTVEWDAAYTGMAYLSVYGMNDCGNGIPSGDLMISVNALPEPVVSGLSLVCDNDENDYSTAENTGSTYDWEVTGGTVVSGSGTYMVTVMWGSPGQGTVTVTETTAAGCEAASETFNVTIDDCTAIRENGLAGVNLYPNPASDEIHITGLEQATIRFFNLLGEEVMVVQGLHGDSQLDISTFNNGIYLVKVEEQKGLSVFRLVVR